MAQGGTEGSQFDGSMVVEREGLYARHGFNNKSISPRRVIMDSAVQHSWLWRSLDPVTFSTEFKKYGWQVTGSPRAAARWAGS